MSKQLAKISRATFGFGGYQDAQFGLSLTFESPGSGVGTFEGAWASPPSEHAKWTEQDQTEAFAKAVRLLRDTLKKAKKEHVAQLVGTPVELTFPGDGSSLGMTLESWRVLEEVL